MNTFDKTFFIASDAEQACSREFPSTAIHRVSNNMISWKLIILGAWIMEQNLTIYDHKIHIRNELPQPGPAWPNWARPNPNQTWSSPPITPFDGLLLRQMKIYQPEISTGRKNLCFYKCRIKLFNTISTIVLNLLCFMERNLFAIFMLPSHTNR